MVKVSSHQKGKHYLDTNEREPQMPTLHAEDDKLPVICHISKSQAPRECMAPTGKKHASHEMKP